MDQQQLERWAVEAFADHTLEVIRDDGLYRHLRCRKSGTWVYGFDVVTWPGYLTVCGDIGTWVFSRERDMLPWFEASGDRINPGYWSEKLMHGSGSGHEDARRFEWGYDEEYEQEMRKDVGWNAQFIYACHAVLLAIRLYRQATLVGAA
jgi:hypothetical protein